MKLVWVRDEYFKPIAVASYVTWGRAVAPARARLSMADNFHAITIKETAIPVSAIFVQRSVGIFISPCV